MKTFALLCFALATAMAPACSPYSPDLGITPFTCTGAGSNGPACPEGYACVPSGSASLCVVNGGTVPDAGAGVCADDSNLEPNDSITTAYITPVNGTTKSISYAGLAVCPAGDKDTYKLTVAASQNIEAVIEFDPNAATLTASILNAGGTVVVPGNPVSGMQGKVRAFLATANQGVYYVQVAGPATGTLVTNNYKLTLTETP
ncbi:hypothetical protein BH11MYX1_BH11MYX1_41680 [soil metagenome]